MRTSDERILTTHCGSLPRPLELSDLLLNEEAGQPVDKKLLESLCVDAVADVVKKQIEVGIDVISDGEQPRVGFSMYLPLRMKGFGGESIRPTPLDLDEFPQFSERLRDKRGKRNRIANPPKAIKELDYTGVDEAKAEYKIFKDALSASREKPTEAFMTSASPGSTTVSGCRCLDGGAPGEIRTHTGRVLNPLPLPVGLPGRRAHDMWAVSSAMRTPAATMSRR